ncbi:MAG: diphthine--ammonia ligase [Candidatus Diapherotrites archaeon]|nr:diphthine--ammonia ligase [Candidatus Diapherotrites archaeon]
MRLASLFSGGKDSTLALHIAKQAGHEIVCLVAMAPENKESFLFHVPNITWTKTQAASMRLPLVFVPTSGKKTREYVDLKRVLGALKETCGIEGVVTGAVYSTYQASRIQRICWDMGLWCFNPLWQSSPRAHWHELHTRGFEIMLVAVAARGLEKEWLGKTIDENHSPVLFSLESSHGVSPIGEGGEFESFVLDAPFFHERLRVRRFEDEWIGLQGTRHIRELQAIHKPIIPFPKNKNRKNKKGKMKNGKRRKST